MWYRSVIERRLQGKPWNIFDHRHPEASTLKLLWHCFAGTTAHCRGIVLLPRQSNLNLLWHSFTATANFKIFVQGDFKEGSVDSSSYLILFNYKL